MKVFVTGGLGYIGSHTVVSLAEAGHDVVIADALYNSSESVLERLEKLTGKSIPFYRIDMNCLRREQGHRWDHTSVYSTAPVQWPAA